ncbi:hypothetical protein [Cupriavidus sp. YAF13]|uniref:hypothetical protein n=1 Tax=Cupriavidus sp. YAF13 TaxID=3233075 RepID=UPI003F91FACB
MPRVAVGFGADSVHGFNGTRRSVGLSLKALRQHIEYRLGEDNLHAGAKRATPENALTNRFAEAASRARDKLWQAAVPWVTNFAAMHLQAQTPAEAKYACSLIFIGADLQRVLISIGYHAGRGYADQSSGNAVGHQALGVSTKA